MALEKNIKLKVTADTKQADANLKKVDSGLTKISGSLKSMAALAGVGLGVAFLKDSISNFVEQERVVAKLDSTLKRNTKSLQDYASQLQSQTRFGDEAIINGMALIGMFVKDEEQIKKLTQATLDLASAKQMDLTSAFDLVSKTAGSSTNALSRYGIEVEGVAGSNERAENTFKAINKIMGGSAASEKDTTYGRVESLKNSFGDLQENIGELVVNGLTPLLSKLNEVVTFINSNKDTFGTLLKIGSFGLTELGQGGVISDKDARWKNVPGYKQPLKETITDLKEQRNQLGFISDKYKPIKDDIKEIVTEVKEWEKAQARIGQEIIKASNGGLLGRGAIGTGTTGIIGRTGAGAGKNGIDSRMQDFVKENSFFVEQLRGDIQILEGEFNRFWQNTFGEANSLLEQFLMNFISGLANLGAQSLFGTVLNFLLPGVGSLAGMAMKPQVINVNLGNETVERVVVGNIRSAQQKRLL